MGRLIHIGYWRNDQRPELPDPAKFVDLDWDEDERAEVGTYLASGTIVRACMGFSPCRICGVPNGSLEFSDGRFLWPEGLAHYVNDNGVRLPSEIVQHAVRAIRNLEAAQVDEDWWLTITPRSP